MLNLSACNVGTEGCRRLLASPHLGNLTALLARIAPAVKATTFDGERTSKNPAYVDAVARKNVELTMALILKESAVLRDLQSKKAVKVAGAMYNLETAKVDFFD